MVPLSQVPAQGMVHALQHSANPTPGSALAMFTNIRLMSPVYLTLCDTNLSLFQYQEFDISDSQEPAQDDGEIPAKKRKASIANKAIIV